VYTLFINFKEIQEPSAFEVEMVIGKLKRHKSPGIDQIHACLVIDHSRGLKNTF
jgi:hypothetical protein